MTQPKNNTEIRGDQKAEILGTLAGWLMWGWAKTLRVEIDDRCGVSRHNGPLPPVIYAMWHNQIFTIPPIWSRVCGKFRQAAVLTSASKDGTILAKAMEVFQLQSVRGSSSRRAVAALIGMKRVLKGGIDICITPDGPRGPKYNFHPGVIKLAESSGVPIVPIHVKYSSAWRLKTWDSLVIPKPFSRVVVVFDEILVIPPKLDHAAFVAQLEHVKSILLAGVHDT